MTGSEGKNNKGLNSLHSHQQEHTGGCDDQATGQVFIDLKLGLVGDFSDVRNAGSFRRHDSPVQRLLPNR